MLKWKYAFLSLSLIELAIGFSNARPNVFFYLGLPLGAIFFSLFLIFQLMEKESALYDEQQRAPEPARQEVAPAPSRPPISRPKHDTNPASNRAHSR
jgi:hypothetical protein